MLNVLQRQSHKIYTTPKLLDEQIFAVPRRGLGRVHLEIPNFVKALNVLSNCNDKKSKVIVQ
jgi:hypothetical protein